MFSCSCYSNISFYLSVSSESEALDTESSFYKHFSEYRSPLPGMIDGSTEWFDLSILEEVKSIVNILINFSERAELKKDSIL